MLRDSLTQIYRKVLLLQAGVGGLVALGTFVLVEPTAGLASLVGAFGAWLGYLVYALVARQQKVMSASGGLVARRHLMAEGAKIGVMLAYLLVAIQLSSVWPLWVVVGFVSVVVSQLFAFLVVR